MMTTEQRDGGSAADRDSGNDETMTIEEARRLVKSDGENLLFVFENGRMRVVTEPIGIGGRFPV